MKIKLPATFGDITISEYLAWQESPSLTIFVKDVSKLSKQAHDKAMAHIAGLMKQPTQKFFAKITVKGKKYGFVNNWETFTTGEWIDCETYATQDEPLKFMCVLYRPIIDEDGKNYQIEEYKGEMHEDFANLPASYYVGMCAFFLRIRNEYLTISQRSLMKEASKMSSTQSGDGTTRYSSWLAKMLQRFQK